MILPSIFRWRPGAKVCIIEEDPPEQSVEYRETKNDSILALLLFQVTNLQPGAKVRVMEDGTKMRRLQSGHGGWLDSYISVRIWHIQLNLIDPNTVGPNYSIFRMDYSGPVFSFLLAHLSTKCSWWAIVVSGCPSSVVVRRRPSCVVRRPSSVNIWCLHSKDHICDMIFMKLCQNVCIDNI